MKKRDLVAIILVILVVVVIALFVKSQLDSVEETIERCNSKGWDGAKFVSHFSNEMICSNLSQAEKDARGT